MPLPERETTSMRVWMTRVRNQTEMALRLRKLNLKFMGFSASLPMYEIGEPFNTLHFKKGYNFRISLNASIPRLTYEEIVTYLFETHSIRFPVNIDTDTWRHLMPPDPEQDWARSWSNWASCYTLADDFPAMAIWRKMKELDIPGKALFG